MSELNKHSQDEDENLEAPPLLVSALKKLPDKHVFVPPSVDETVLMAAHRNLTAHSRTRFPWFRWKLWAAATAIVLAAAVLTRLAINRPAPLPDQSAFIPGDLNHDGQIDILDAFALSKQLKFGPPPDGRLDLNGDGVVDERDVATIAARAVKLEKGGRS